MTITSALNYLCLAGLLLASTAQAADSPTPTAPTTAAPSSATAAPLDYLTLTHKLSVTSLRAGSHDESGSNDYYFDVKMYALLNSAEERNAAFDARKKIASELGTFGDTQIESLAIWKPDEKLKNYKELKVDGNGLRELAAKAMTELKVQESGLAIMVEIAMFERQKKFGFFGDDTLVAKTTYFPIPQTKFDAPLRANQNLVITDDKGTHVTLSVQYDAATK